MTFWETFVQLCDKIGTKPNPVAKELGISSGSVTAWKNGATPSSKSLAKIAAFFGVPMNYLMNDDNIMVEAHNNPVYIDDETRDIIDSLRTRPEMKVLFSVSKNATKEDIELAVKMIEKFKSESE